MATWLRLAALVPLALWSPASRPRPRHPPPLAAAGHPLARRRPRRGRAGRAASTPRRLLTCSKTAIACSPPTAAPSWSSPTARWSTSIATPTCASTTACGCVWCAAASWSAPRRRSSDRSTSTRRSASCGSHRAANTRSPPATSTGRRVIAARSGHATLTHADRRCADCRRRRAARSTRAAASRGGRASARAAMRSSTGPTRASATMRTTPRAASRCRSSSAAYAPTFEESRAVGHAAHLRRGVVSRVGAGWRPYAHGSWRHTRHGWTWIDQRSVGLAGAPLRPLGPASLARLVLDAAPHVGSGLGRLGGAGRLRRVGAARLELAAGRGLLRRRAGRPGGRVGRQLVGDPARRLRPARTGRPVLRRPPSLARPGARRLRAAAPFAARTRRMGRPGPRPADVMAAAPAGGATFARRMLTTARRSQVRDGRPSRGCRRPAAGHSARRRRRDEPIGRRPATAATRGRFGSPVTAASPSEARRVLRSRGDPAETTPAVRERRRPDLGRGMRRPAPVAASGRSEPTTARRPSSGTDAAASRAAPRLEWRVAHPAARRTRRRAARTVGRRARGQRLRRVQPIRLVHAIRRIRQIGRVKRIRRVRLGVGRCHADRAAAPRGAAAATRRRARCRAALRRRPRGGAEAPPAPNRKPPRVAQ